jgi:hypothetical protein
MGGIAPLRDRWCSDGILYKDRSMSFWTFEGGALSRFPLASAKPQLDSVCSGPSYTMRIIQNPTFGQNYRPTTLSLWSAKIYMTVHKRL